MMGFGSSASNRSSSSARSTPAQGVEIVRLGLERALVSSQGFLGAFEAKKHGAHAHVWQMRVSGAV